MPQKKKKGSPQGWRGGGRTESCEAENGERCYRATKFWCLYEATGKLQKAHSEGLSMYILFSYSTREKSKIKIQEESPTVEELTVNTETIKCS